jgi:hypothetical protein
VLVPASVQAGGWERLSLGVTHSGLTPGIGGDSFSYLMVD